MALCTNLLQWRRVLGMYDRKWYDSLRVKYDAASLTNVYEKVKVDLEAEKRAGNPSFEEALRSTWPISGLYGLKKAIESGAYLQARDWAWKSVGETSRFNMKSGRRDLV